MLRTLLLLGFSFLHSIILAQELKNHTPPEQNLFVTESPKPQSKGELQSRIKTGIAPKAYAWTIDASLEWGITDRLWFGPKGNYSLDDNADRTPHSWDIGLGGGFNVIFDEWFLLSFLLDATYGSEQLTLLPMLALYKSVDYVAVNMSGSIEINPMSKESFVQHELSFALFSSLRPISPVIEFALEIEDRNIMPQLVVGFVFLAVPTMQIALATQMPLPKLADSSMLLSFLKEF